MCESTESTTLDAGTIRANALKAIGSAPDADLLEAARGVLSAAPNISEELMALTAAVVVTELQQIREEGDDAAPPYAIGRAFATALSLASTETNTPLLFKE